MTICIDGIYVSVAIWVYFSYDINSVMIVNLDTEAEYRELWDDDDSSVQGREYL